MGYYNLRDELVSALEELEKCRKKNKQSSHIISDLDAQLLDDKRIEEDLNLQLKIRIQEYEKIKEEIIQFKKNIDEGSIKSKFENSSRMLYDILNSQRASSDRSILCFNKEKKPECFSFTNQGAVDHSKENNLKLFFHLTVLLLHKRKVMFPIDKNFTYSRVITKIL